jgi:hypothetical protein
MKDQNKTFSAKKISLGGILLALTVITLFAESILPTSKLSLYALSSFFISVMIMESGAKAGLVFYISSVLLAFIVVQNKIELIPYAAFFGNYGLIKYLIEKLGNLFFEYILKILYFSVWLTAAFLLFKSFFAANIKIDFPWWTLFLLFEAAFLIYDYVYTLIIRYYSLKLKSRLKITNQEP